MGPQYLRLDPSSFQSPSVATLGLGDFEHRETGRTLLEKVQLKKTRTILGAEVYSCRGAKFKTIESPSALSWAAGSREAICEWRRSRRAAGKFETMSSFLSGSKAILRLVRPSILLLVVIQLSCVASHGDLHKERTHDGAVSPNQEDEDHSLFEHSSILGKFNSPMGCTAGEESCLGFHTD